MKTEPVLVSKIGTINLNKLKEYAFDTRYVCDSKGSVYLIKETLSASYRGKPISPFTTKDGYIEYVLTDISGKKKHIQAHRIVAGLFLKTVPGKDFVNHKDGNKANNKYSNLVYMTHPENIKHTYDTLGRTAWNKGKNTK